MTFALTITQSALVNTKKMSLTLIIHRETQRNGKESAEEESPLTRTSSDASAKTRSQEVRKGGMVRREEAAFCGVSIMRESRGLF